MKNNDEVVYYDVIFYDQELEEGKENCRITGSNGGHMQQVEDNGQNNGESTLGLERGL